MQEKRCAITQSASHAQSVSTPRPSNPLTSSLPLATILGLYFRFFRGTTHARWSHQETGTRIHFYPFSGGISFHYIIPWKRYNNVVLHGTTVFTNQFCFHIIERVFVKSCHFLGFQNYYKILNYIADNFITNNVSKFVHNGIVLSKTRVQNIVSRSQFCKQILHLPTCLSSKWWTVLIKLFLNGIMYI